MFGQVCGKTLGTLFQGGKFFKTMRNIAYASGITAFTMLGFDVASLTAGAFNRDSPLYQFNKYLHKSDVYSGFQFFVTTVAVFTGGFARATKDCIPSESGSSSSKTSYGKSIENTEFFKENGGLDASDYISIHSRKHMYDPDTVSTPKKTQYGKDVNVGKLCEDTIMKPDEVIYNIDQNVMIYKKEYPFNISTSDTPTGTHRVFIPLNTQGKKTIRMSQFPLVGGN